MINVRVRDVMSRHPLMIGPDATLLDALVLMRGQKISGLPVVDASGALVGVLSQRDIARALTVKGGMRQAHDLFDILIFGLSNEGSVDLDELHRALEETNVREAMSTPAISIAADASLELAADLMREKVINRIPVVKDDRVVGIITRNDLLRALVHH